MPSPPPYAYIPTSPNGRLPSSYHLRRWTGNQRHIGDSRTSQDASHEAPVAISPLKRLSGHPAFLAGFNNDVAMRHTGLESRLSQPAARRSNSSSLFRHLVDHDFP
ncbi:hypothetical protein FRC07_009733, partial [Ceratobasidium sp. 392]